MGGVLISTPEEGFMIPGHNCVDVTKPQGEGSVVLGETSTGADVVFTIYIKMLEDVNCCRIKEPNRIIATTTHKALTRPHPFF